jgi:hypothetical protein
MSWTIAPFLLINYRPDHPQTLGLERFHKTLKEWLADELASSLGVIPPRGWWCVSQ